jgi:hypothetical protein
MTSIDAVTITAQFDFDYSRGGPDPDRPNTLWAHPGIIHVATWDAGVLSLTMPDGTTRPTPCPRGAEAVGIAARAWNTPDGIAAVKRWMAENEEEWRQYEVDVAAATWTGERRHEWQEPKRLVALVKAAIKQAVKDGILPMPNDYRVTWRKDENAIDVRTHHAWWESDEIGYKLYDLLQPFNASKARVYDGGAYERRDFDIEVEPPAGPSEVSLAIAYHVAAMERAGFPCDYIVDVAKLIAWPNKLAA